MDSVARKPIFRIDPYLKDTLFLAGPICVGQLGQMMFSFTDTIMIGKLGAAALAAAGFCGGVFAFFLFFGFGMASSVGVMVSQGRGNNSPDAVADSFRHGLIVNLGIGIIGCCSLLALANNIEVFRQSPEVNDYARNYMICLGVSLIPMMLTQAFRQYSEAMGNSFVPMLILFTGLLANLVFDYIFIFGRYGFPRYELLGAGIGTLVARVTMLSLFCLFVLRYNPRFREFLPKRWFAPLSKDYFRALLKLGVPSGFQYIFETGAFTTATIIAGWLGTQAQAAHQISLNMASITFMIPLGLGMASSLRVGYCYGLQDYNGVYRVARGSQLVSGTFMFVCAAVFLIFRHQLPKMYIQDPQVILYSSQLLILAAFFQIFDGTQTIALSCLRGIKDTKVPTALTFIGYYLVTVPVALFLGRGTELGAIGVWIGLTSGLMCVSVFLNVRLFLRVKQLMRGVI